MLPLRGLARIPDETPGSRQKSPHSSEESPTPSMMSHEKGFYNIKSEPSRPINGLKLAGRFRAAKA